MPVDIITPLRTWGRASASDLRERLGVSRATLMRAVRTAGDHIIVRGNARRSTYAARRALRGNMAPIPVYRVDSLGTSHEQGQLNLTYPDGTVFDLAQPMEWPVQGHDMADGWYDGLPYPLQDMRPQGFLGRNFARNNARILQVDEDPTRWSDDDALHALTLLGDDAPGNLIIGEIAFRRWLESVQAPTEAFALDELTARYPELAEQALSLGIIGSSAGGEFPKFTTRRRSEDTDQVSHVIVKFSGNDNADGTLRWSDLLVCEHLAANVVATHLKLRASHTAIYKAGNRTFLEVVRFDRHGNHGRSGLLSLQSLNAAFLGSNQSAWPATVQRLAGLAIASPTMLHETTVLWHFGRLIANTDMHEGNLSFEPLPQNDGGLRLAPSYDMVPMMYAPARGVEVVARRFEPHLPLPNEVRPWRLAAEAALEFWRSASGDERISPGFQAICAENSRLLQAALTNPAVAS